MTQASRFKVYTLIIITVIVHYNVTVSGSVNCNTRHLRRLSWAFRKQCLKIKAIVSRSLALK